MIMTCGSCSHFWVSADGDDGFCPFCGSSKVQ